ncbi:MAG: extracellular solute-binding protein [Lachnospiraceae bacterium]|nr:extracellular solute-binding protein [Lachnospiraceae bacterium]
MSKVKAVLSKKYVSIPLAILAFVLVIVIWKVLVTETGDYSEKYEGHDLSVDIEGIARDDTYDKYLEKYQDAASPEDVVDVDILNYTAASTGVSVVNDIDGEQNVVQSDESGFIEWMVDIPKAGLYSIYLEYYPLESRGIDIERAIYINDEMPFYGADAVTFNRVWADATEITKDNRGNDIRPTQGEAPIWQSSYVKDYMGYHIEPYKFYFNEGVNKLKFVGVNEPLVIRKVTIMNPEETPTYEEYVKNVEGQFSDDITVEPIKVQGEDSQRRSSPSLYPNNDRASGITEPYSSSLILLNKIGGNQWRVAGDWIEWDFEVPEDGFYNISFKGRQNYNRGFVSSRAVTIDGECPFEEGKVISFQFGNDWQMNTLSDENGNAYKIGLTKGVHTIRLAVTLGELGNILTDLNDSVFRLNAMYRKILVLTGATPDEYRDYKIDKVYPEIITGMDVECRRLYKIVDELIEYSGERGSQVSSILTVAAQLERFVKRPDKIPKSLGNFKENVSAIGTGINSLSEAPLDIDCFIVSPASAELPECEESFIDTAMHEIRVFIASFVVDYTSLGNVYEDTDSAIDCWILSGRDQSTILKTMIDDTFVPEYGIGVNVKLIDAATLLPAVVAGTGPDVALTVAQTEPVNYALRNAAVDLTQFPDWEEWKTNVLEKEYYHSSYLSYEFNGGIYALPETQNYNVLFYREDILDELGVKVPETWEELIDILPTITNNNLQVGIPSTERKVGNTANPDLANYFCQLYQRGAKLYADDQQSVAIDSEEAIEAFEYFTKLFTNYKVPTSYDFVNRFRSGEMPIGIQDFSNYNTLVVFAPEIKGLWNFALVPGYERVNEDGETIVDRSVQSWGQCSMILNKTKGEEKYDLAWTFLKWWISSDTQVRFGRELESVMGASARYATANTKAFEQLSWSKKDLDVLKEQWKWAFGVPEIAGGYYTSRHITNAIRNVMNDNDDPRETILDYTRTINDEIKKKRQEFGLPVNEDDE